MIVKDDFLSKLRRYFSLNLYEVKIWAALLSRGVSTAGELSDIANVPRSRSYDVLESLEKKGFIVVKIGKPIKYLAVSPNEVVERVKKNIQKDSEERERMFKEIEKSDLLKELNSVYTGGINIVDVNDLIFAIKGRTNIHEHLSSMIKNAKNSVVLATSASALEKKFKSLKPHLKKAKERGVSIRLLSQLKEHDKNLINELKEVANVKHADNFSSRFAIVDDKEVLVMLSDDKKIHPDFDSAVWMKTPYFAESFKNMFNHTWERVK